jgi:hypothetical protein
MEPVHDTNMLDSDGLHPTAHSLNRYRSSAWTGRCPELVTHDGSSSRAMVIAVAGNGKMHSYYWYPGWRYKYLRIYTILLACTIGIFGDQSGNRINRVYQPDAYYPFKLLHKVVFSCVRRNSPFIGILRIQALRKPHFPLWNSLPTPPVVT